MNEQDLYDVNKYALAINRLALEYIVDSRFNPLTSELCLTAVKNNEYALRFIDCQTDEICITAIKSVAERRCDDPGINENGLSNKPLFSRTADQLAGILVPKIEKFCINNFNTFGITTSNYLIDETDGPINSPLKYVRYQKENICKFAVVYCNDVLKVIKN